MSILAHDRAQTSKKLKENSPKSTRAVLSDYLWIPKSVVKKADDFASDFEYVIDVSHSASNRLAKQQMSYLRENISSDGLDPDEIIQEYDLDSTLTIRSWSDHKGWWAVCRGNQKKIRKLVKRLDLEVVDKRIEVPLDLGGYKLKLKVELRPNQIKPLNEWVEAGYGILRAAPAFGKTVVMIALICMLRQCAIVFAHTDALADQFIERFRKGSPRDDGTWQRITNCKFIEKKLGREIIGRYRPGKPLYPITVCTYQSFIRNKNARKRLKALNGQFGLALIDEVHRLAAPTYAKTVNTLKCRWRMGVSATTERKDRMEVGVFDVVGPVTANGHSEQLPVKAYMMQTGFFYQGSKYPSRAEFVHIINKLLASDYRNKLILKTLKQDIKAGRNVLILSDRVKWCYDMSRRIAQEYNIPSGYIVGGLRSENKRDEVISQMVKGKIRVIVATKVLDEGVDIKNLDTLYLVCPMNNAPVLEQRIGRIRRFYEKKQPPMLRYFVDEGHGMIRGCAMGVQKALVNLGIDVDYVRSDAKPGTTAWKRLGQSTSSLARVANRNTDKVDDLINELEKTKKSANRYNTRIGL